MLTSVGSLCAVFLLREREVTQTSVPVIEGFS
jgi:hypothetical protein